MIKDLLLEIIDRYLTSYRATPISLIRTKFPSDLEVFEKLLSHSVVEALDKDDFIAPFDTVGTSSNYVPRMLAFEFVGDIRRKQKALNEIAALLRSLRNFARFVGKTHISEFDLLQFSRRYKQPSLKYEAGSGLAIILAKDFPKYVSKISRAAYDPKEPYAIHFRNRAPFEFDLTPAIEQFENPEEAWAAEMVHRKQLGLLVLPQIKPTQSKIISTTKRSNLFDFVADTRLRSVIERDYAELQRLKNADAIKSRFVLAGGLIEAMLLDILLFDPVLAMNTKPGRKEQRRPEEWGLSSLLDAAVELKLITASAQSFGHSVREFRNLVHPGLETRSGLKLETEEVQIAENVLAIIIRDLNNRYKAKHATATQP